MRSLTNDCDRQDFILKNTGLAYSVANRFINSGIEYDDLISICFLGLIKATDKFQQNKGVKFLTFAIPVITNEILMELRKMRKTKEFCVISLDAELDDGGLMAEIIPDKRDCFSYIYASDSYQRGKSCLTDKEKMVFDRMISGVRQEDIGKQLGLSQSYISRIHKGAVSKMRTYM